MADGRFEFFLVEPGNEVALIHGFTAQMFRCAGRVGRLPVQAGLQIVNSLECLFVSALLIWVGMDNQVQFAAQIVEHHHVIGHHQQDVGRADLVRRAGVAQALLDVAHGVITEIANQATIEAGQFLQVRRVEAGLIVFHEGQWIVDRGFFDHLVVAGNGDGVIMDL